jgi:uncharacterized protein YbjT (DUF2867 family)
MPLDVVTGAFSFTGRAIAEELLARGREARTLARAPARVDDPLRGRIERFPVAVVLAAGRIVGAFTRDVMVTRDELAALQAGLLESHEPPLGHDSFSAWLAQSRHNLGRRYASEVARNFRPYGPL